MRDTIPVLHPLVFQSLRHTCLTVTIAETKSHANGMPESVAYPKVYEVHEDGGSPDEKRGYRDDDESFEG